MDIFFVLSGFLISFILLKEFKKTGKIDMYAFYRGRFLRLWPVMVTWAVPWTIYFGIINPDPVKGRRDGWGYLSTLTFTNNWMYTGSQGWSLAVEFQFYLLSPLIVYYMARSKGEMAVLAPMFLFVLSTILRAIIIAQLCPDIMAGKPSATCADPIAFDDRVYR